METTASSGTGLPAAMAEPAVALVPGEPFDIAAAFAVAGPVGAPTLVFLHGTRVTRAVGPAGRRSRRPLSRHHG
jgi:hypothetical protein